MSTTSMGPTRLSYRYQPLKRKRDTRLLRLESGQHADDLRCSLCVVHLDDEPIYEALSYAWGEAVPSTYIFCSGRSLPITQNLSSALRCLRYPDRFRDLWVDAISVNQQDLHERGRQVRLMRDVFKGAYQVLIWLGEASDDAYFIFEVVDRHTKKLQEFPGSATCETHPFQELTSYEHWSLFTQFYERAWFMRLWIIQEVAWARQAIVTCGHLVMDWQVFSIASGSIFYDIDVSRSISFISTLALSSLQNINSILKTSSMMQGALVRHSKRQESLAEIVPRHRQCRATDPRDKIFALLGVSTSLSDAAFPVDYTKSTAAVYTDFALYTMREEANTNILFACSLAPRDVSCVTVPSWVPDWTRDLTGSFTSDNCYQAADGIACSCRLGENSGILIVDGLLVTHVAQLCSKLTSIGGYWGRILYNNYSPGIIAHMFEAEDDALTEAIVIAQSSQTYGPNRELSRHFVQALTGYSNCRKYQHIKFNADVVDLYAKYCSWIRRLLTAIRNGYDPFEDPELVITDELVAMAREIDSMQINHKFCRFTDGHIGWVPKEAVVGDQIAIFVGAQAPMLLRPHNDAYLVVGDSYVYEMMDGEALKDPSLKVESIKLV
ncbi:hypothetical protein MMC27_000370 [Xylographa pallens]|nr:hypothetical protein [Xylographa pallens]